MSQTPSQTVGPFFSFALSYAEDPSSCRRTIRT